MQQARVGMRQAGVGMRQTKPYGQHRASPLHLPVVFLASVVELDLLREEVADRRGRLREHSAVRRREQPRARRREHAAQLLERRER